MKPIVVTAYVPLDVKHLNREQYYKYGKRLVRAVGRDRIRFFSDFPLEDCWLYKWMETFLGRHDYAPATEVPSDRYETAQHMVWSNIVQHNRTKWLKLAAEEYPDADCFVWLDLAILKQGDWTGKPVTEEIITQFVDKLERSPTLTKVRFPGIWEQKAIPADHGDNWRFCGSTHVIPRWTLDIVDAVYQWECQNFIGRTSTVPLDLPIWALTELRLPELFRWYQANHDATQLTNFPFGSANP